MHQSGSTRASWARQFFDGGDPTTVEGRALLQERYSALQRQVPLIYLLICADYVGLNHATPAGFSAKLIIGLGLLVIVIARLAHWIRIRRLKLSPEAIHRQLRKTVILGAVLSASFAGYGIYLLGNGTEHGRHFVVVFISFTSIGCAYGLSSFPAVARMPLLLLAAPFAVQLIATQERGLVEAGLSLGIASLLALRMLHEHEETFRNLVVSRVAILQEQERAQWAEREALAQQERAVIIAETDDLTQLPNRRAFLQELDRLATTHADECAAIALIDLDSFKPINDTFGHQCGDTVLVLVGERLRQVAGSECLAARMGGDEFAILAPRVGSDAAAQGLGERICECLSKPFIVDGRELRLSGSCGLTLFRGGEQTVTEILTRGDAALYAAKQEGHGLHAVYADAMGQAMVRRARVEQAVKNPNAHEEMALRYQPIFELKTHKLTALEALSRWEDTDLPGLGPAEFIPVAEQMGTIEAITHGLLKSATAEAASWPSEVLLSFNMSAIPLCSQGYGERLLTLIDQLGFDCSRLQLEVTETALLNDLALAGENLRLLRAQGTKIVLDDFGAGYASVSYLQEIEFDAIKLDGSLIQGTGPNSEKLLRGVLDLCASMGVPCVAEHIETQEQLDLLTASGCRDGQGFYLAPPLTAAQARVLARAASPLVQGRRVRAA